MKIKRVEDMIGGIFSDAHIGECLDSTLMNDGLRAGG